MVKLEDGYAENKMLWDRYNSIKEIATEIFGSLCQLRPPKIIINHPDLGGNNSEIDCIEKKLYVRRKEDYDNCFKLAERCEIKFGKDFILRTEYKTKP